MKKLLVAVCLAAVPAAASAPELERAMFQATALARAAQEVPGGRTTPDADSDVEPTEALGNFHEVAPGLYRSAQPSREGYKLLKAKGVKTILTLKDSLGREREEAGAEGLAVENVPMSGFAQPSFEQVDRALAVIADVSKRPLLVHCQVGKDRTGFVIASYRVVVEHMDEAQAAAEARSYGCCFAPFGDLNKFLKEYRAHRALRGSVILR
ncbi:MAG: tyrosine-protein phosphatase [Elusimicrobia bacterium]|nr:tyrosine-protein phosphatase [Elusimicrobiota bacterium]